ncbi:MAG: serpin family protein [Paludibacter sp.]|nr:serpin family protein [Paludibacter sp.]
MKKLVLLLLPLLPLAACEEPETKQLKDAEPITLKAGMEKRVQQDNAFAFDLFRQVLISNADEKNIFISPLSVSIALGMTWNGAKGETKSEMETALKMSGMTVDQINEYYQIMLSTLPKIDPSTKLSIANSIWPKEGYPVKPDFLRVNQDYFNAEVQALDFSKPEALKTINDWCARKTNDLIKDPLEQIPANAIMYLINAIYFKGIWATKFDSKNTTTADFHAEGGNIVKAQMMRQETSFDYYEDESAQYLDMPYGNKAFSMTVILPRENKTTAEVVNELNTEKWNDVVDRLYPQEVQVSLPKFKTKGKYELKDPLIQMGMRKAFDPSADFTGIADDDLMISGIIHSTYCDVNEEGTEAAAVTIVEVIKDSMPEILTFNANRPFIFVIREKSTGVILFMGKMGQVELYK